MKITKIFLFTLLAFFFISINSARSSTDGYPPFPRGCTSTTGVNTNTGGSCASLPDLVPGGAYYDHWNITKNRYEFVNGCTSETGVSTTTGISCASLYVDNEYNFYSKVKNEGNATALVNASEGYPLWYLFWQVASGPGGTGTISDSQPAPSGTVVVGHTDIDSTSHSFNSIGTHSIRICVDVPPYPNGIIFESNENNNCSPWTDINVISKPVAQALDSSGRLYVTPTCTIPPGGSACYVDVTWMTRAFLVAGDDQNRTYLQIKRNNPDNTFFKNSQNLWVYSVTGAVDSASGGTNIWERINYGTSTFSFFYKDSLLPQGNDSDYSYLSTDTAANQGDAYKLASTTTTNVTATASCATGTSWQNGACRGPAPSVNSVSISPNPVPYGATTTISYNASNAYFCYILLDSNWSYYNYTYGNTGSYTTPKMTSPGSHTAAVLCYNSDWANTGWNTTVFTVNNAPVNGGWSGWSTKSAQCGYTGTQTRTCTNPSPAYGGASCSGSSTQSYTNSPCPINGGWSGWSTKSAQCGYTGTQTRTCTNPAPAYGGASCSGSSTQSYTNSPCPINGGWSAWGGFGACSLSCGGGTQSQSRTCTNPTPAYGGASCSGSSTQSQSCNTQACTCSAPLTQNVTVACDANSYGYSAISGSVTRSQTKSAYPGCTFGSPVTVSNSTYVTNNCAYPAVVNGGWSAWSSFGACSLSCGGGSQSQSRTCTNPSPAYGGASCSGSSTQSQACNTQSCNNAPSAPIITGPSTFYKNVNQTFNIRGTDPDSGDTVRYIIDWNMDGLGDYWEPLSSPYYASGYTMVSPNHSWPSSGSFKVLTQDINGAISGWTVFNFTANDQPVPASIISFTADKINPNFGESVNLTWSSTSATSCSMTSIPNPSVNLNGLPASGTKKLSPLKTTIYSLTCTGPGGTSSASPVTVTVGKIQPTVKDI